MRYCVSNNSGRIFNENNVEIIRNDNLQEFKDFLKTDKQFISYVDIHENEISENNFLLAKQKVRHFLEKKKTDGLNYFNDKELELTIQLAGMAITNLIPISNEIETILYKPLNYIKSGDYFSAMMLFNNPETTMPTNTLVLQHWNEIKNYCINYFNNNYPTENIE